MTKFGIKVKIFLVLINKFLSNRLTLHIVKTVIFYSKNTANKRPLNLLTCADSSTNTKSLHRLVSLWGGFISCSAYEEVL